MDTLGVEATSLGVTYMYKVKKTHIHIVYKKFNATTVELFPLPIWSVASRMQKIQDQRGVHQYNYLTTSLWPTILSPCCDYDRNPASSPAKE